MTDPVDPTGYWRLLRAIFEDRRGVARKKRDVVAPIVRTEPQAPPTPLVLRPTLNRAEVRGRVLAIIAAADREIDRVAGAVKPRIG